MLIDELDIQLFLLASFLSFIHSAHKSTGNWRNFRWQVERIDPPCLNGGTSRLSAMLRHFKLI